LINFIKLPGTRDIGRLFFIVFIGLLIRFIAIMAFNHAPESDELIYQDMALNLINHHGIIDGQGNRAMYNVGYPLFALSPMFALFGENLLAPRLLNALLGGVSIALCYAVAAEAGAGRTGRLLAAAMWALYLPASVYAVYLLKENLMTPLMLGLVWCALRLAKQPSAPVGLACGVLFGLLALTGNAGLCLVAPVLLALAFTPAGLPRKLSLALVILVSASLIAAPWLVRNMRLLGAPVLNTNGGFNLYLGNNPAATGLFVSIADTPRGPTWKALRKNGEIQASETLKKEAIAWIQAHPSEFLNLAVRKAGYFWTPPFHQGQGPPSKTEAVIRVIWGIQFIVLLAGIIGSLIPRRLRNREAAVLWLAIASYTAVHMLFYVIFRYREPIMPLVCILAALGFESLLIKSGYPLYRARTVGG
jgi:4-amino-4-deoxy-L-arabinose transferase-like glycosyltransferase